MSYMTADKIAQKIIEIANAVVPTYLSEAQTESYPYGYYTQRVLPQYTKDGIAGYSSQTTLTIVSDDFDEADNLANTVNGELLSQLHDLNYSARLVNYDKNCIDNVWQMVLYYEIKQLKQL